jgi:hypothetical protein
MGNMGNMGDCTRVPSAPYNSRLDCCTELAGENAQYANQGQDRGDAYEVTNVEIFAALPVLLQIFDDVKSSHCETSCHRLWD